MCGPTEIDGYAFCLGVDSLKGFYEARADLRSLILSVTYLIRGAIFRPNYFICGSSRVSQDICPLGELIDMYHTHEATKRHDKVYALLGMSSDDLSKADLLPNYQVPWEKLLQRLAKFLLYEKISVETWGNKEMAVIKSKGCILGKVSSVQSDIASDNRQGVDVIVENVSGRPGYIRTELLQSAKIFTRDFLLVWDWENSPEKLQDLGEYKTLIQTNNSVSGYSKTELEGRLDKATRTWDVALILGDSREYKKAEERL